ncbi:class I SAM-dependent methyltransferase [Pseudomonas putida]|nr:class I SAM-dependent methyltransferase [Pseudomonas putida]
MDTGLLRAIYREITLKQPLVRTPEPDLVMADDTCVTAYADSARQGQALSGTYLYHCAQMCALIKPGDVVLDIGCGPASLLLQLARLNPRAEFIGADLSASMLEVGRASIDQQGIDNVELREEDMTRLAGIADRSVDVVISSMALHHLADLAQLEATFRNIARVLRNDRAIYLNDFGRLKSVETVDYFVSRASERCRPGDLARLPQLVAGSVLAGRVPDPCCQLPWALRQSLQHSRQPPDDRNPHAETA